MGTIRGPRLPFTISLLQLLLLLALTLAPSACTDALEDPAADAITELLLSDAEEFGNHGLEEEEFDINDHRRLQSNSQKSGLYARQGELVVTRDLKRTQAKRDRLSKMTQMVEAMPMPASLVPDANTPPHTKQGPAIFAAAMGTTYRAYDVTNFCGTARKAGYTGDLVMAIQRDSNDAFKDSMRKYGAITYTVDLECVGESNSMVCSFKGYDTKVSINMVRFYIYQWWTRQYSPDALILLSDFRDVFFQSNPFTYRKMEWAPPVSQLVVFQEPYPNKVIYRCMFNSGWIRACYGKDALETVHTNTVSCSGVTMGTRDAIMIYTYLMTEQLDPKVRYGKDTKKDNGNCITLGMDQGFHNWLIYSGQLDKYMDVKVFQQGEGPVNTVGAFWPGPRALIKWSLEKWGVLRGEAPEKYFYNWNGDKSPMVHQADRFLETTFKTGYANHLGAFRAAHKE